VLYLVTVYPVVSYVTMGLFHSNNAGVFDNYFLDVLTFIIFGHLHILPTAEFYLMKSSICFMRRFGLSSGMKCPVFGNVIPVTLFATF
jgi:hypothetical protein